MLHLKSRLACRHFLSAWFRWIPLLGVRVLMASGSALIHRNWCEKWVNKYNRSRRRLTQFCPNQYSHLLVLWQWSNHFCLSVIPQLCVNYHWHLQGGGRGWLCLMYIVDSDSILCKRDLFFKKSLFSIVRFYEVQKCWVCNMLLSIFDVCCSHKVRIKVEKERERLQLV